MKDFRELPNMVRELRQFRKEAETVKPQEEAASHEMYMADEKVKELKEKFADAQKARKELEDIQAGGHGAMMAYGFAEKRGDRKTMDFCMGEIKKLRVRETQAIEVVKSYETQIEEIKAAEKEYEEAVARWKEIDKVSTKAFMAGQRFAEACDEWADSGKRWEPLVSDENLEKLVGLLEELGLRCFCRSKRINPKKWEPCSDEEDASGYGMHVVD